MSRRHYVYYRVAAADLPAAAGAVGAFQAAQRSRLAGLQAELLRRPGEAQGLVTLMEVYVFAAGQDAGSFETEAALVSAPWRRGERHVEVFEPLA